MLEKLSNLNKSFFRACEKNVLIRNQEHQKKSRDEILMMGVAGLEQNERAFKGMRGLYQVCAAGL